MRPTLVVGEFRRNSTQRLSTTSALVEEKICEALTGSSTIYRVGVVGVESYPPGSGCSSA